MLLAELALYCHLGIFSAIYIIIFAMLNDFVGYLDTKNEKQAVRVQGTLIDLSSLLFFLLLY